VSRRRAPAPVQTYAVTCYRCGAALAHNPAAPAPCSCGCRLAYYGQAIVSIDYRTAPAAPKPGLVQTGGPSCQACGSGPLVLLGVLGRLEWRRCQACGMEFSAEAKL